ncbi:MAG: hypothetical protein WC641_02760 [Patescibacteria group bacterium]
MTKTFKKAFSTLVSLTTIVWSVGIGTLVMPSVASAATLSAGDLIKASGPAVYYYATDGKRYVFPNEKTYFSWYVDFSSVKTITDGELAAVTIGGNVTIRPGTKLVKITTDPKTYAVTKCGTLHWIESESIAKALYGDAWATRVVDVPDSFFVNYSVGSSVATNVHPDGSLVSYTGDTSTYVVQSGAKRKIASDAAFAANGWNKLNVIPTTITYGNGSDVTGREADFADTVCAGATPGVTGALTVALASDTPAGMTLPKGASSVPLVKVNLTAGSADVAISGLSFHRVGVGATSDFANIYLYDQDGNRLTTGRSINSTTNMVEFNAVSLTVPANGMKSVYVYGDVAPTPTATGGQHSFEVLDAASVVVSGSATVSGSYPIRGNVFTIGSSASARLDVLKGTTPNNPTIGSKDVEISNFKLTANTHDISVSQISVYQAGSVTNSDLTNFKLYQGTTVVATAAAVSSNGHIVIKFSPAYVVANGTTKVFSLRADVAGRAARTIKTYTEYSTDVTALDTMYSAGAQIDIATNGSFDGTGTNFIEVTTQGGQLTNASNGPVTSNVSKGALAVQFYKFALTSPDNTLEIRNLRFTLNDVSGGGCKVYDATNSVAYFRSIKVVNLDTGKTWMGPKELTADADATSLVFSDSQNIAAGQTVNLAVVSDLANVATTDFIDCGYNVSFVAFGSTDVRVVETGEYLSITKIVPNTAVTGNTMTVKASSLTMDLGSTPNSQTIVKKQQNVPVSSVVLTASNQSDITITSLTLGGQAALSTSGNAFGSAGALTAFALRVTSLALFDGTTQVGLAKAPDTTTGKAQISNMNLVIPKGTSKTLTVKASFSSTASTTAPYDQVAVGVALAADVSAQDADSNSVTPTIGVALNKEATLVAPAVITTIRASGIMTVAADAMPTSVIVVAGKDAWVPFASYKATAQYEDISIDRIAVVASSTTGGVTADNADFSAVAIAYNGAVKGQGTLSSGATGTADIDLTGNLLTVPKDGSLSFQVWGKLSAVAPSSSVGGATTGVSRSGHAPRLGLNYRLLDPNWDANYAAKHNIRATGAASGERIYAAEGAAHGNIMVLRKTQPIVTKQSLTSTTLANIDLDLFKFQIAADAQGSVSWKQAVFSFSKTAAIGLTNFRLRRGTTDLDTATYAITNGTTTADLKAGALDAGVNSGYIIVSMSPGNEESISSSGNPYTIHATVSGAASGNSVALSMYKDPTAPIVTGYLVNSAAWGQFGSSANIFNIDTGAAPQAAAAATGTFLWSDQSEVPHSAAAQTSRDWTNDVYINDLSQTQALSL